LPDAVSSQLYDGARNVVVHLNNVSDGTGQTNALIVDVSTLTPNPTTHLALWRASFSIRGGGVIISWDATVDQQLLFMGDGGPGELDFSPWGGLWNNAGAGVTGDVLLSTVGFAANSGYSITLEFKKGGIYGQNV